MNSIQLTGNITADAETKAVGDTNVINFSIANNDKQKKNQATGQYETIVCFMNITFWSKTGKMARHLLKGKKVTVSGRLDQDHWTDDAGQNRSKYYMTAFQVEPAVMEKVNEQQQEPHPNMPEPMENDNTPLNNDEVPF